jgi:peptidoglycan/LPS O-acetylase OafA/YrhL
MLSSGRWLAVGSAILGVGALLAISWLVYALQSETGFWSWPGIAGVSVAGIGLVALVVGMVMPDEQSASPSQHQRAGSHSINLQAGRDIKLGDHGSSE